jgi:hypothetical protein
MSTKRRPLLVDNGVIRGFGANGVDDVFDAAFLVGAATLDALARNPLAVTYASSIALDVSLHDRFVIGALTGDLELNFTNAAAGRSCEVWIAQDSTGGRRVGINQPSGWKMTGDSATLAAATAANAITRFRFGMWSFGGSNYLDVEQSYRTIVPDLVVYGTQQVVYGAGNRVVKS